MRAFFFFFEGKQILHVSVSFDYFFSDEEGGRRRERQTRKVEFKVPLRLLRLCVLGTILPAILVAGPIYLRYRVYSAQLYPLTISDQRLIDGKISTTWCQVLHSREKKIIKILNNQKINIFLWLSHIFYFWWTWILCVAFLSNIIPKYQREWIRLKYNLLLYLLKLWNIFILNSCYIKKDCFTNVENIIEHGIIICKECSECSLFEECIVCGKCPIPKPWWKTVM